LIAGGHDELMIVGHFSVTENTTDLGPCDDEERLILDLESADRRMAVLVSGVTGDQLAVWTRFGAPSLSTAACFRACGQIYREAAHIA
jgi:hypothetical protein